MIEAERSLRESHPDCKVVRYCCGAPLSHVGAINYLAKVGDVSMVARDRNMCPQRTILLVRA